MDTKVSHADTIPAIIRHYRGNQTLAAFADQLNVTRQAVWLWEDGRQGISESTVRLWWEDPREWVHNLARDILAVKFSGIRQAFQIERNGNGRQT